MVTDCALHGSWETPTFKFSNCVSAQPVCMYTLEIHPTKLLLVWTGRRFSGSKHTPLYVRRNGIRIGLLVLIFRRVRDVWSVLQHGLGGVQSKQFELCGWDLLGDQIGIH